MARVGFLCRCKVGFITPLAVSSHWKIWNWTDSTLELFIAVALKQAKQC
jgi:hypothetical protein